MTYRVGDRLIGVRTNDAALSSSLRDVLRAHVVPDVDAPPNLSLLVGSSDGRRREFHHLYRGSAAVVRARSKGRLVRAALAHLDAYGATPRGTVRLDGRVLVRDGTAMVVDSLLASTLDRVERRAQRLGYAVVDVAGVPIDEEQRAVALWPPRLDIDHDALTAVNHEDPPEEGEAELAAAQLPVRGVALLRLGSDADRSPAGRLVSVARLVAPDYEAHLAASELVLAQHLMNGWSTRLCSGDEELLRLLHEGGES
jgi:hypothetical protein